MARDGQIKINEKRIYLNNIWNSCSCCRILVISFRMERKHSFTWWHRWNVSCAKILSHFMYMITGKSCVADVLIAIFFCGVTIEPLALRRYNGIYHIQLQPNIHVNSTYLKKYWWLVCECFTKSELWTNICHVFVLQKCVYVATAVILEARAIRR